MRTAVEDTPGGTIITTNSTKDCEAGAGVVVICNGGRITWFRGGPIELEVTNRLRLLRIVGVPKLPR